MTPPSIARQANACIRREGQRREMAKQAVDLKQVSIAMACRAFSISESCYRYERKLSDVATLKEMLGKNF